MPFWVPDYLTKVKGLREMARQKQGAKMSETPKKCQMTITKWPFD